MYYHGRAQLPAKVVHAIVKNFQGTVKSMKILQVIFPIDIKNRRARFKHIMGLEAEKK